MVLAASQSFPPKTAFAVATQCWTIFYIQRGVRFCVGYIEIDSHERKFSLWKAQLSFVLLATANLSLSLYHLGSPYLNAYSVSVQLLGSFILNFVCKSASTNFCYSFMCGSKFIASFFRLLTVFMILLKLDGTASSSWSQIFW